MREEAIGAKNEIVALKAKVAELKKALKTASEERSKQVGILEAKIVALQDVIQKLAPTASEAKTHLDKADEDKTQDRGGERPQPLKPKPKPATKPRSSRRGCKASSPQSRSSRRSCRRNTD